MQTAIKQRLQKAFIGHFDPNNQGEDQASKVRVFFAPGRVNLIGEHTDYNGGHVLPCALSNGTYMAVRARSDNKIALYSENFVQNGTEIIEVSSTYTKADTWTDYVKGVLHVLAQSGYMPNFGFDAYLFGNIPNGAGLSSSASLELVALTALVGLYNFDIDPIERVKFARAAENSFVGVNCGIMDQFVIGMGKHNHAVLLDTETLDYSYAPLELNDCALVIANTNKRRGLADSKYNERFSECRQALRLLQQGGIKTPGNQSEPLISLGALDVAGFEACQNLLDNEVLIKRARHAVSENQRTLEAHKALGAGNLVAFGQLMNQSHASLKDDYEVTGIELDTLVALSQAYEGVIGSRMTGAGFGGCTVTLIKKAGVQQYIESVGRQYLSVIGYAADFYTVEVGDGAREI